MSTTFLSHAAEFVNEVLNESAYQPEEWVLEIASNDGYLLKNFLPHKIKVIGIEPAENVAQISRNLGIETIAEFFSSELAREILVKHGYPKLIIANNVMAHVPDLVDFIEGLSILAGPNTKISIGVPWSLLILV
jgi:predicted N-formylglutamate amidohydrolase